MAFSLSDLLNPAPPSGNASPNPQTEASVRLNPTEFAPELFETSDEPSLAQQSLAVLAADANHTYEATAPDPPDGGVNAEDIDPQLKQENTEYPEDMGLPQWPADNTADQDVSMLSQADGPGADFLPMSQQKSSGKAKKGKTTKDPDAEKEKEAKPTKHSSKNEGQHTDRRYLCYHCNKLFTRRRSVRDHIVKIHSVKSWEPVRSLEVIVDPTTGEPVELLEDIIARGPPPTQKPPRAPKEKRTKGDEEGGAEEAETTGAIEHDPEPSSIERESEAPPPAEAPTSPLPLGEPRVKREEEVPLQVKAPSPEPVPTPAPVIGKKRPASEITKPLPAAITKKGIAKPKPAHTPNKRPKLSGSDSISEKGTPTRSPGSTPAASARAPTSKLKQQLTARRDQSLTPTSSRVASIEPASPSPSAADTPGSSNDDGEVFCICRKGDNHTWMIACDGGCDEWFHGNCVHIRERDGDLIDKYICPRCVRPGLQTTWKRMCRRKGCRKPARVFQDPPSKYCSKECGRMFFVELIRRGDPYIDTLKNDQFVVDGGRPKKLRKKRRHTEKPEKTQLTRAIPMVNGDVGELVNSDSRLATPAPSDEEKSENETDSSADEDQLPNRGGALRASELKSIVEKCGSIEKWRELGRKPDTPPREPDEKEDVIVKFDEFEKKKLDETAEEKAQLEKRSEMLEAREKMLNLIKARSSGITEELKKEGPKDKKGNSKKDPCGFDPRLSWSEERFLEWYDKLDGKNVLESGRIGPPEEDEGGERGGEKMVNGVESEDDSEEKEMPKKGGVCVRNRCPRHRNWAKGQLAEIRFEQDVARRGARRCEEVEREVRERAVVRAWETR